jgi:hypothetical protein
MAGQKTVPSPVELLGGKKKKEPEKPAAKHKGKAKHKSTSIEHHDDGSHTVRHVPHEGGPELSYAAANLDAVHDGLEEHLGEPNHDEEMKHEIPV